jgi:hypothetical protein
METIEIIDIVVDNGGGGPPEPDPIVASVALGSVVIAQQASALGNLAYGNQVSSTDLAAKSQVTNQNAMNRLRQTILANAVASVQSLDPAAARSTVFTVSSNAMAQEISSLKAAVDAFVPPS